MYMPGAPGGERAWDTLELELPHIVVSHRVGSGTQTQVLLATEPSLRPLFYYFMRQALM